MRGNLNLSYIDQLKNFANPNLKPNYSIKSIPRSRLKSLYYNMLKIRLIEQEIAKLAKNKIINTPVHLSVGQEAIPVGIIENLKKKDEIFGNHRSHGHIIAKGTSIKKFFSECYGKSTGLSRGFGGSMHLIDKSVGFQGSVPIVGATIPIACGFALSKKLQKKDSVTIAFFGDGACEEGSFHETLNFASLYNIPILFVVENNLFSSHLDINLRQPSNKISRFAEANKIKTLTLDGNNIVKIYKESKNIINYIRKNQKPFFLETITYRHLGHVGPNKDIDVGVKRNKKELAAWTNKRDPIENFERFLIKKKIINHRFIDSQKNLILNEIKKSVNFAEKSKFPDMKLLKNIIYNEKN